MAMVLSRASRSETKFLSAMARHLGRFRWNREGARLISPASVKRPSFCIVSLCMMLGTAAAAPPKRVDLPALLGRARLSPNPRAAAEAARAAHAKVDEVSLMWVPQLELTAVGGPSPRITCHPSSEMCISTEPSEQGTAFSGLAFHIDAKLAMPVYTFGKLSAGTEAAEAGARAADALAAAAANDAALDAARAYFAVKLARELILLRAEAACDIG